MKLSEFKKQLKQLEEELLTKYGLTEEEIRVYVINPSWHMYRPFSDFEFEESDNEDKTDNYLYLS